MPVMKRISFLLSKLVMCGLVVLGCNCIVYSANLKISDSVNIHSVFYSEINQSKINYQKTSGSFYRTDSIFSFHSPKGYFPSLLHNIEEQATAPFKFKTKEWLLTGAAAGITAALIIVDDDVDRWARVQKQNHNWINKSSPFITKFGDTYGFYSVTAGALLSAAFKNEKGVKTSLLATQAMITSGLWVHLIKLLTSRERPKAAYIISKSEGGKWYGPFALYDQDLATKKPYSAFDAFPSGHTAVAFSIATVFASQYNDKKVIPVLCYSAATLIGISRMTEHEHWVSDVFAGGLIGYLCGRQVVAHYNKIHQNSVTSLSAKSKKKTELNLIQYGNQIELSLKW
jgi:membrane-associated phospholipid phosphatase